MSEVGDVGDVGDVGEVGEGGIARLLAQARDRIDRVTPLQVLAELDDGALLVDTRPEAQRRQEGEVDPSVGALVVERNVLEWRLDPTSDAAIPEAAADRRVIVMCQEGYSSSLAADALRQVGVHRAADLDGGFAAWKQAGLPVAREGGVGGRT